MTKIIDFKTKGNVIRFYLGADDCFDYWGDDWDDRPYEHNAGEVYDRFVVGYADIYVDMNLTVYTPEGDWSYNRNSPFCKEDFQKRKTPCVIIADSEDSVCYSNELGNNAAVKFYFEDKIEPGTYFFDAKCLAQCPRPQVWKGVYLIKESNNE